MKAIKSSFKANKLFALLTFASVAIAFPQASWGQTNTTKTAEFKPKVSGLLNISRSRNLIDYQDGNLNEGQDYSLRVNLSLNKSYTLIATGSYSQDLRRPENDSINDSSLILSKSPKSVSEYFLLSGSASSILPTSKTSSQKDNLIVGLRAGLNLSLKPEVLPTYSLSLGLSGGQNIHKYETNTVGSVLNKYTMSQSLSVGKESGRTSLSFVFANRNAWSYFGYLKQSFEITEEIGYSLTDSLSLALGHTNAGSALKNDGYGSNIALANENDSLVYGSMTMGF